MQGEPVGTPVQDRAAEADVIVVGSGAAGLTAALTAAVAGLRVTIIEKANVLGGTSAMSGAAAWVPANHHARAAGIDDSPEDALEYLRTTAPQGWAETEDELWRGLAMHSAAMLAFVEQHTPLQFALTIESDVYVERPGGKARGRMVSPKPLRRRVAGPYARHLRGSTLPHIFTYQETTQNDLYRKPVQTVLKLAPRLAERLMTGARAKGTALIAGLLKGCLDYGCRIEMQARAVKLITDETHAVVGLVAEQRGRTREFMARRGVLIATGGFEWNSNLAGAHFPGPRGVPGSPRSNEGDAIGIAREVGAQLAHMDQALMFVCAPTRYEGQLHAMPLPFHMESNAILVDRNGCRFVSEFAVDIGEALDRRDPITGQPAHLPAWMISDARHRRPVLRWYARHVPGWIRSARTLEALADMISVPPAALAETVRRFNEFCEKGQDADFHRGESAFERRKLGGRLPLVPIQKPPYVAVPVERTILSTKGGLRTDARARVLRDGGQIIPGLYCAGVAMANPIGTRAISAGTTIGPNMTWGYIAANDMLTRNDRQLDEAGASSAADDSTAKEEDRR